MADLIDRVELRKDFCNMCEAMQPEMIDCNKKGCMSMQIIDEQPAVNRWIPCIERLPEPLQNVIVCTDINTVTVAWLNGDHWTFADTGGGHTEDWSFDAVKYWMPLPEPPKE